MTQTVTRRGTPCQVAGQLPVPGDRVPDFSLTTAKLADVQLADYVGKRKIFNIFPSMDTPTCALSVKRFNAEADALDNVVLFQISADLPFAHSRFCTHSSVPNHKRRAICATCRTMVGRISRRQNHAHESQYALCTGHSRHLFRSIHWTH